MEKNPLANAGHIRDMVRSLGWEDAMEKGAATHSSILAWRSPMDRGAWRAAVHGGHNELDTTERLST